MRSSRPWRRRCPWARATSTSASSPRKVTSFGGPEGNELCVIEPGNQFLADCGFVGALSCDGSQEVGYFWSEALGWPLVWDQDEETAIRSPLGGPKITWGGPPLTPKIGKSRQHFDLAPPLDGDQRAEVDRLISLGATRVDIGQGEVPWVVMADPDGHEFCVLPPAAAGRDDSVGTCPATLDATSLVADRNGDTPNRVEERATAR